VTDVEVLPAAPTGHDRRTDRIAESTLDGPGCERGGTCRAAVTVGVGLGADPAQREVHAGDRDRGQ
jgi:hypothetical protein